MNRIKDVLEKEILLNKMLNSENIPQDLSEQFKLLFAHAFYEKTSQFLGDKNLSIHDGYVKDFSQKKQNNDYQINFKINAMAIYQEGVQVGYLANSQFEVISSESLRDINNKCILNFLIDEKNKEIAFLVANGIKSEIVLINYEKIVFSKGQENYYSQKKALKYNLDV